MYCQIRISRVELESPVRTKFLESGPKTILSCNVVVSVEEIFLMRHFCCYSL